MCRAQYLISLGYPFGAAFKDPGITIYQVEFDNLVQNLNIYAYQLWRHCLNGITIQELVKSLGVLDVSLMLKQIYYLETNKLLISLDLDRSEGFYNKLDCYVGFRQGTGIGLQEDNKYWVHAHKLIEISKEQFIIWSQNNNRRSIAEITLDYQLFYKIDQDSARDIVTEAILVLIGKGLIFLTGITNV